MHCKNCNYPLWNLRSRTCPECGSGFAPSDFDFQQGAVRFCCPHCNQEYYGTSPSGHLTPRSFNCVSCQQPVDMDEMVLLPAAGFTEQQTARVNHPWLSKEGSLPRRWLRTVGWAMVRPGELIDATPLASSRGPAWTFALATYLVVTFSFVALWMLLMMGVSLAAAGGGGGGGPIAGLSFMLFGFVIMMVAGLIGFVVSIVLWAATAHLALLLTGGGGKGFGRTMHAALYSSGANVLSIIPCVNYFAWIWWVVSFAVMLWRGHGVSGGRAALAAIAGPVVFLGLLVAVYAAVVAGAMNAGVTATRSAPGAQVGAADAARAVTSGLLARQRASGWPDHGARLLEQGLSAGDFAGSLSPTTVHDVMAGGMLVSALEGLTPAERTAAIDEIAAALPENVVAHRVGDFVFTYHGMAERPDPRLWVLIECGLPSEVWSSAEVRVAAASGAVQTFPAEAFPAALDQQNGLRADHGLPPLWHPDRIDDGRPQGP